MNRVPVLFAIAFAAATAQQSTVQQKTIKNPAEWNAYMRAVGQSSPQAKAQAFEAFVQQYPNSVVEEQALEQLLGAYMNTIAPEHRAGFSMKLMFYGNRLLKVNPDNLTALVIVVHEDQAMARINPQYAARLRSQAADLAERGLKVAANARRPDDMSEADYAKFMSNASEVFNRALSAAGRRGQ